MDNSDVKSVWSEVANDVKKQDIKMMKAFAVPPKKVADVCMAVCLALDPSASP
jgi:hypothetical protein